MSEPRDGRHDFDFLIGDWTVQNRKLKKRLEGCSDWDEFPSSVSVRPLWDGAANFEEWRAESIEGLTLRVYNPRSRQWSLAWANKKTGTLDKPMLGEFRGGRGEFFDHEEFSGRFIYVRYVWSEMASNSCRWEQAFSDDGGKHWETNWIMQFTRAAAPIASAPRAADHDFSFLLGDWTTRNRRRAGSDWIEFESHSTVHPIWGGAALLEEYRAKDLDALSLNLFNPRSRQWSQTWATRAKGVLEQPTVGEFTLGRGEFHAHEPASDGRMIWSRIAWSEATRWSCNWEQSSSRDGGRSWEADWQMQFQRPQSVIEFRQYAMQPGKRDTLLELFAREFEQPHAALGMPVLGKFHDLDDPDRYIWLRAFPNMDARKTSLSAFYDGPIWKIHRDAANATIADSDNVLLLKPIDERSRFPKVTPGQPMHAVTYLLKVPVTPSICALMREERERCGVTFAAYETETAANNFRHPLREGEHVVVWFAPSEVAAGIEARLSHAAVAQALLRAPIRLRLQAC